VQVGVAATDVTNVALEVLDIDCIESDDGRVETHIGFSQSIAKIEWAAGFGKVCFSTVQGLEQCLDVLLICLLCSGCLSARFVVHVVTQYSRGKSGLVDTVVYIIVGPLVSLFDVLLEIRWEKIDLCNLFRQKMVKGMVEHPDDFTALVVDDTFLLFVVQSGYGEAAVVVGVVLEIDVSQVSVPLVERIRDCILSRNVLVRAGKSPTCEL